MLLLSIPGVQTFLGRYATNQINATYGTAINVEKVGIQFNGDLELKNILIKDHHNDTLIAADELNSSLLDFAKIKKLDESIILIYTHQSLEILVKNFKTYEMEKIILICASERIRKLASNYSFKDCVLAKSPLDNDILNAATKMSN